MDGWMDKETDGQQNSSNDGNNDASCRPLQSARCCASPSPIHPGTEGDGRERAGQRVQLVVRKPLGLTRERPQCDDERRLPAQRASRYVSSRLLAFSPVLVRAFRSPGRGRQEGRKKRGDGKGRKKERKKERKEDETADAGSLLADDRITASATPRRGQIHHAGLGGGGGLM